MCRVKRNYATARTKRIMNMQQNAVTAVGRPQPGTKLVTKSCFADKTPPNPPEARVYDWPPDIMTDLIMIIPSILSCLSSFDLSLIFCDPCMEGGITMLSTHGEKNCTEKMTPTSYQLKEAYLILQYIHKRLEINKYDYIFLYV